MYFFVHEDFLDFEFDFLIGLCLNGVHLFNLIINL